MEWRNPQVKSLNLARAAMGAIVAQVGPGPLGFTTYAAATIRLADGRRAIMVTTAGAGANGIPPAILNAVELACPGVAVFGAADTVQGQGNWHMNDAEQQVLRTMFAIQNQGAFAGSVLKAVVASRNICASCTHFLQVRGFAVNGTEADAP